MKYLFFLMLFFITFSCTDITANRTGELNESCYPNETCEKGLKCSNNICITDLCSEITCSDHGECAVLNETPICVCNDGYHSKDLECIINDASCSNILCSNHGKCEIENQKAVCNCDQGYHPESLNCIENPANCDGVTCSNHGICEVQNKTAVCICDGGYYWF